MGQHNETMRWDYEYATRQWSGTTQYAMGQHSATMRWDTMQQCDGIQCNNGTMSMQQDKQLSGTT